MKINFGLIFFIVALITVIAAGMALFISFRTSGISLDPGAKALEFAAIETGYDPNLDANTGFVIQPYQTVNPDQNPAVLIGAAVSYILREVKAITLHTLILAAFALTACVIIVYIVLNKLAKPFVEVDEVQKYISEIEGELPPSLQGHDKENNSGRVEAQYSRRTDLYSTIDKMLADIYSVTGNPEIAGANELVFPSDAARELMRDAGDNQQKIA
jgi:hypothetical protein